MALPLRLPFRRALIGLLAAAIVLPALPALADGRSFPAGARRGTMTPAVFPEIIINGDTRRMAAGGRILSQQNLIVMPASVEGSKLIVNYLPNPDGTIQKVWLLTAAEGALAPPKPPAAN